MKKRARDVNKTSTHTHFDALPSDVVEYIAGYTNQLQPITYAIYSPLPYYNSHTHRMVVQRKAAVIWEEENMTNTQKLKMARKLRISTNDISSGHAITIDDQLHILVPATKVYKKPKPQVVRAPNAKSKRCWARNKLGKRCKIRTFNQPHLCYRHCGANIN
jgi:hypothetical protein